MPAFSDRELEEARTLVRDASDDELLDAMAKKHRDLALASAALEEFIDRHKMYVACKCGNLIDRYGTASGWEHGEFCEHVFERVYNGARTYRPVPAFSREGKLRRLKGWMGRIANNLLVDKHRRCCSLLFDEAFLKVLESPLEQVDAPTYVQKLLCEALQELSDRERLVLVRTLRYMQAGKRARLPNNVARALRDELQTTSANVRKIRERAKDKVKTYFAKQGEDITKLIS